MYKLEPDDIQGMLADAARVLTQPKDKELMRRLIASTHALDSSEWDKRLMAAMLAKAGKLHESEMVVHDIEAAWERADALLQMGKALKEMSDDYNSRCILHVAAIEATKAQQGETEQERLDASAVLAELACYLLEIGEAKEAKKIAALITNESRREKFDEYLSSVEAQKTEEPCSN